MKWVLVRVWVCECGSYFGGSHVHNTDLRQVLNIRRNPASGERDVTSSRATCPDCGKERVPIETVCNTEGDKVEYSSG